MSYKETFESNSTDLQTILNMINELPDPDSFKPVLQEKTVAPTTSQQSVTADEDYDGLSKVTINAIQTTAQAVPTISIDNSGLITATAIQSEGYVSTGTKSATKQLQTKDSATYTPTTNDQIIISDIYLTGSQIIKGDSNLKPENIVDGVSIFGVTGSADTSGIDLPTLTNEGTGADLLYNKQLIDQNGNIVTGTIPTKTSDDLTASGATVTIPAGYYASQVTKNVSTTTQSTPTISIDSTGKITASSIQFAGYVSAGTKSATKQLTTQAAKTITPSESSQTAVASGVYTTGDITVGAIPDGYMVGNEISAQDTLISQIVSALEGKTAVGTETWILTLEDGSTVIKEMVVR